MSTDLSLSIHVCVCVPQIVYLSIGKVKFLNNSSIYEQRDLKPKTKAEAEVETETEAEDC